MEGHKIPARKNIFETVYSKLSKFITPVIAKTRVTPNEITLYSGLCGAVGGILLLSNNEYVLITAGIFIQLIVVEWEVNVINR